MAVMGKNSRWYATLFDSQDWLERVALRIPHEQTQAEVDFILEQLHLPLGSRVLDLACGHGRHSLELSSRGYDVTGVDLSGQSLAIARSAASERGLNATFLDADMRGLTFDSEFHAALILFSSFGYLEDEEEDQRVLESMQRSLRPNGSAIIDVLNLHWLGIHPAETRTYQLDDGSVMLTRREFDAGRRRVTSTWSFESSGGSVRQLCVPIHVYGPREFTGMLEDCGLLVERLWGNFEGAQFSKTSNRMIILARKPISDRSVGDD
jgi:SAM-dependent methyltransferase